MSERLLESRIAALRGQVRRLLAFHGLSWMVAAVVPLVILAGLADWLFHLDLFVRLALLVAVAAVAALGGIPARASGPWSSGSPTWTSR